MAVKVLVGGGNKFKKGLKKSFSSKTATPKKSIGTPLSKSMTGARSGTSRTKGYKADSSARQGFSGYKTGTKSFKTRSAQVDARPSMTGYTPRAKSRQNKYTNNLRRTVRA